MQVKNKFKIFLSSNCRSVEFKRVRANTKKMLEDTGFFSVYVFEDEPASTLPLVDAYLAELDDCHASLFFIDENEELPKGVEKEVKRALETNMKSFFVFLNGTTDNSIRQRLIDEGTCKFIKVLTFDEFTKKGCESVCEEMVKIYGYYCKDVLQINKTGGNEVAVGAQNSANIQVDRAYLKGFKNTYIFFDKYVIAEYIVARHSELTTSDMDDLSVKIFTGIVENGIFDYAALEVLCSRMNETYPALSSLRLKRFKIIANYYKGNIQSAVDKIKALYEEVNNQNDIPQWLKDDILIDYRNLITALCNCSVPMKFENEAQDILSVQTHRLHYPDIDRLKSDFNKGIIDDINKENYKNIFSTTFGDVLVDEISRIADIWITALFYGSLTQLWQIQLFLKEILLRFAEKYTNVWFKKQLLKLHIIHPEKDSENIVTRYNYIWGHCSRAELGEMLPAIFAARYSTKEVVLKTAMKHLANFLSDDDYLLVEKAYFEYAEQTNPWPRDFIEVLKWAEYVPTRINVPRMMQLLKKRYENQEVSQVCEYIIQTLAKLDLSRATKNDLTFVKKMVESYFAVTCPSKDLRNLDIVLIKLGKLSVELHNWVVQAAIKHYPGFLAIYNFNNSDVQLSDVESIIEKSLSEIDELIVERKQKTGGMRFSGDNGIDNLYRFLKATEVWPQAVAEEALTRIEKVLLDNNYFLSEKYSALKLICFIASKCEKSRKCIAELAKDHAILGGEDANLFSGNISKTTLATAAKIVLLICDQVQEPAMLLNLYSLENCDKARILTLICDNYNFASKNKIMVGVILQFVVNCISSDIVDVYYPAIRVLTRLLNTKFKHTAKTVLQRILREGNYYTRLAILRECRAIKAPESIIKEFIKECSSDNNVIIADMINILKQA